jgi:hypothetical protein
MAKKDIQEGLQLFRKFLDKKDYATADKIVRGLVSRHGMTERDFVGNTTFDERKAMRDWMDRSMYIVTWVDNRPGKVLTAIANRRKAFDVEDLLEGKGVVARTYTGSQLIERGLHPGDENNWDERMYQKLVVEHGMEGLAPELRDTPDEGERPDFDEFFDSYIETALWSTNDESDEYGGNPLDDNYGPEDFDDKDLKKLRDEAWEFFETHQADFDNGWPKGVGAYGQAGHDFWLTRNGHGAGFWDGDWRKPYDDQLTEASKTYGSVDIMVGDDGKLYV